jgi:hypothetical protein
MGPFGSTSTPGETITVRHPADFLLQGPHTIDGESDVENMQINGSFKYDPSIFDVTTSPTVQYPTRINWKCRYLSNPSVFGTVTFNMGRAWIDNYLFSKVSPAYFHYAIDDYSIDGFTLVTLGVSAGTPTKITYLTRTKIWNLHYDPVGKKVAGYAKTDSLSIGASGIATNIDWSKPQSCGAVLAYENQKVSVSGSTSTMGLTAYTPFSTYVVSPSVALSMVETWSVLHLIPDEFPISDYSYGDLAMEATNQANANSVNMIAFLKDLRHPTEMIPKLRNLTKLKTLAHNYLTVDYGILPTISDLQSIWRALHKVAPYVDSKGHTTYSAGHSETKNIGDVSYSLDQHIKVAINDEDISFVEIINKIDSAGFLPTCENLWDLLPYSFVVDWFVSIGDFLARIDSRQRIARLGVRYTTASRKTTATSSLLATPSFPYTGSATTVVFNRWVSDQCPLPTLSVSASTDFNHWLESGALLIQRAK